MGSAIRKRTGSRRAAARPLCLRGEGLGRPFLWALRAAIGGAIAFAGCAPAVASPAVLDPVGPVGAGERTILFNAVEIMLVIVVPTILATFAFAWWYRASNTRARYLPDWAYSGRIELITWSIPVLVVLFLGGVSWIGSHELDPYRKLDSPTPPLEIQAVSLDWKWLFIYPGQGIASVNQLTVPVGVPLHFSLTSASVLNTFFVPRLGSMIYAMSGMSDQLNLQADAPGSYYGESGQFSGDGFSDMHFVVNAVPGGDFSTWVAGVRGKGQTLDDAAYRDLSKQSTNVTPFTYGAVQAGLYDMIVAQRLPPGPGPQEGEPSVKVRPATRAQNVR